MPSGARKAGSSCSLARVRRYTGRGQERAGSRGRRQRVRDLEPHRRQGRGPVTGVLLVADHPRRPVGPQPCVLAAMPAPEGEPELPEQDVDLTGVVRTHLDEVERRRLGHRGQRAGGSATEPHGTSEATRFSTQVSERRAWRAVRATSVWRKMSLKTSSDSGPSYPARRTCPTKVPRSKAPSPGNRRWWRDQDSTSMRQQRARRPAGGRRSSSPGCPRSRQGRGRGTGCGSCRGRSRPPRGRRARRSARRDGSRRRTAPRRAPRRRSGRRAPRPPRPAGAAATRRRRRRRSWRWRRCCTPAWCRAEPLHERELRARPAQDALELRLGHALRVAERLVEVERQPEPCGQGHDLLGAGRRGDQVGFEDLDAVEARVGGGVQLVGERAAEADGGDRGAHRFTPPPREGTRMRAGLRTISWWTCSSVRAAVEQGGHDPAGQVLHGPVRRVGGPPRRWRHPAEERGVVRQHHPVGVPLAQQRQDRRDPSGVGEDVLHAEPVHPDGGAGVHQLAQVVEVLGVAAVPDHEPVRSDPALGEERQLVAPVARRGVACGW